MTGNFDLGEALVVFEKTEQTMSTPFGDPADIRDWLNSEPPEIKEIFEGLLVQGIVGGLFAQGGVGKTYLMLCLMLSAALGTPFFRTFRPTRSMRVLGLLGEDPPEMIHRRLRGILKEFGDDIDTELLSENLRIYSGKGVPFMQIDNGNPKLTSAFEWLKSEAEDFRPDLIFIDPKSMFYGLNENDNDHNTQWVVKLRELTMTGATVLFSHHVTKTLSGVLELNGARGGSALVDGSRFAANMRQLPDDDAEKYGIDEPWRYIEFKVTKNSYIPKLPGSIFFKFTEGGALEEIDLKTTREYSLVEDLLAALTAEGAAGNFYTAREIERDGVVLPNLSRRDRKEAVRLAVDSGQLVTETITGKGRPRAVLVSNKGLLADMAQTDCAEVII